MAFKVSYTSTLPGGLGRKRWYVWRRTGSVWRKERLSVFVARMQREGNHDAAARAMALAIQKGYRLS